MPFEDSQFVPRMWSVIFPRKAYLDMGALAMAFKSRRIGIWWRLVLVIVRMLSEKSKNLLFDFRSFVWKQKFVFFNATASRIYAGNCNIKKEFSPPLLHTETGHNSNKKPNGNFIDVLQLKHNNASGHLFLSHSDFPSTVDKCLLFLGWKLPSSSSFIHKSNHVTDFTGRSMITVLQTLLVTRYYY